MTASFLSKCGRLLGAIGLHMSGRDYWRQRAKHYGRRAVLNLGHSDQEFNLITQRQKDEIYPVFRKLLKGDDKLLLDFGCGPGRFTSDLASMIEGKAIGIDILDEWIRMAPRSENVQYMKVKGPAIPFPDESFDVVWICLVLGGLNGRSLRKAVNEIRRILKKGGLLFLVENISDKKSSHQWTFRKVPDYQEMFTNCSLSHRHDYFDLGERISIMAGRKLG